MNGNRLRKQYLESNDISVFIIMADLILTVPRVTVTIFVRLRNLIMESSQY